MVLSQFRRLVKLDRVRHTAKVDSAIPLAPAFQAGIEAGLVRLYGKGLEISFDESSALIGGMRIRVGSDVFDGSIQGRLAALEASF
jgi:F-type H+-transporting ATPase subunit delta